MSVNFQEVTTMFEQLFELTIPYGLFALLFVWLLHTTNKRNELREDQYQDTIKKNQEIISQQAKSFSSLSGDVREIKDILKKEGTLYGGL